MTAAIGAHPDTEADVVFQRDPANVGRDNPFVTILAEAIKEGTPAEWISVGRDGASDAISFIEAGVPAVEFGPIGGGHHGPDEWVSDLRRWSATARPLSSSSSCYPASSARAA